MRRTHQPNMAMHARETVEPEDIPLIHLTECRFADIIEICHYQ